MTHNLYDLPIASAGGSDAWVQTLSMLDELLLGTIEGICSRSDCSSFTCGVHIAGVAERGVVLAQTDDNAGRRTILVCTKPPGEPDMYCMYSAKIDPKSGNGVLVRSMFEQYPESIKSILRILTGGTSLTPNDILAGLSRVSQHVTTMDRT